MGAAPPAIRYPSGLSPIACFILSPSSFILHASRYDPRSLVHAGVLDRRLADSHRPLGARDLAAATGRRVAGLADRHSGLSLRRRADVPDVRRVAAGPQARAASGG